LFTHRTDPGGIVAISVRDAARQRLRNAQRAEAAALAAVTTVTAAREGLEPRTTAAERPIDEAVAELVAVTQTPPLPGTLSLPGLAYGRGRAISV
jgi:hypothetical protein